MRLRALTLALLGALVVCSAACAPPGAADVFGPIELLSLRSVQGGASGPLTEQAESAGESVVSADGRYVVFTGSFAGHHGIWRRDLQTGAVEQVAPGRAKLPSVSAEGRYVSFTTTEPLAPEEDHNRSPDVYLRDMERPCSESASCAACPERQSQAEREACPFVLVSAVNGSLEAPTYSYPEATDAEQLASEEAAYGSLATGASAISATGESVAFETGAVSNLLGTETPAREILVRNVPREETRLVSSEFDPQTGQDTGVPVPVAAGAGAALPVSGFGNARFGGASIDAAGNIVTWEGQQIARQARLLPQEQDEYSADFDEPLYRDLDEGPSAATRRVTGGSDPEDQACAASGEQELPLSPSLADPCQGPFTYASTLPEDFLLNATNVDFVPKLSASGNEVAFLASAKEVAAGQEIPDTESDDDLYVSEIGGQASRVAALKRITELASEITDTERAAPIYEFAISPDGSQLAFTTRRTEFPLGSLTYVSPVQAQSGVRELFDADLADGTLTRITHGFSSESASSEETGALPEEEGATSPSFDRSGELLSFSSGADNLVYGDGNDASDAYLVRRTLFTNTAPQQYLSSPPPGLTLRPAWQLSVTAEVTRDGTLVLNVLVPGAGSLSATASATVPEAASATSARRRHGTKMALGRSRRIRRHAHSARISRIISQSVAVAASAGGERLTLTPQSRYSALVHSTEGLYATVRVQFAAPGRPVLTAKLSVVFKTPQQPGKRLGTERAKRRSRGRRGHP